jgi:hypothetical protein
MKMIEKLAFLNHNRNLMHPINREKMYWFFREQFRFGHRDVLLDYLGLDYSYLIEGFLQHGVHIKVFRNFILLLFGVSRQKYLQLRRDTNTLQPSELPGYISCQIWVTSLKEKLKMSQSISRLKNYWLSLHMGAVIPMQTQIMGKL